MKNQENYLHESEEEEIEIHTSKTFHEAYEYMMQKKRSFLCSIDVLEDPKLSMASKVLFQVISSLCINKGYCYGSNGYLADRINMSESSVKRYLMELQKEGLIKHDTFQTQSGFRRKIYIQFESMKRRYNLTKSKF